MKKAVLPLVIGAILTGCGSDSDSSSTPAPESKASQVSAVFMDAHAVQGVAYKCDSEESGKTNEQGSFSVAEGAICTFELDGYALGKNREGITEVNNQVTAYSLEAGTVSAKTFRSTRSSVSSSDFAAKISALLQSIDLDKTDDKVDVSNVVGETLISANPLAASDFKAAMQKVEIVDNDGIQVAIPAENIVEPEEAKESFNNNYYSENVAEVISDIKALAANGLTETDIEAKLIEYRQLLEAQDGSNGYHQKAADAILEIVEIANMEEVAARVDVLETDYTEMLAKLLDVTVNPDAVVQFNEKLFNTTEDVSAILAEAAARLFNASARLGAAMPGEGYVLPYADDESQGLTYQDTLVIRTGALVAANALYTLSSYNMGSDAHYMPQSKTFTDVKVAEFHYYNPSNQGPTLAEVTVDSIETEFTTVDTDPKAYFESEEVLTFRSNAGALLAEAKNSLAEAVKVAQLIDLEAHYDDQATVEEDTELLAKVSKHLADGDSYLELDGTYLNLHALYNVETSIDRSDFIVTVGDYVCTNAEQLINPAYSEEYSQILGFVACSHENENNLTDWGWIDYNLLAEVSYDWEADKSWLLPAVPADVAVDLEASNASNMLDIMWCGFDELSGDKISCED